MGWFGKSKKSDASPLEPSRYAPPDINEKDDSSDEEMIVLDFTSEGAEKAEKANKGEKGKDAEKVGKQNIKSFDTANPSDIGVQESMLPQASTDDKDHPYHGSKMDTEHDSKSSDRYKSEKLEQLRTRAEDGPFVIRIFVVLSVLGMLVTSAVVPYLEYLRYGLDGSVISHCVISTCTLILGLIILVCEFRYPFVSEDRNNCSTRMRMFLTKHLSFMRLLWGRGLFCVLLGLLHAAHMNLMTTIFGSILSAFGLIAFCVGRGPSRKIEIIRHHKMDDTMLYIDFRKYDYDQDGFIDIDGYIGIIAELDLDMDTYHTIREFNAIDSDHDGKISFEEFRRWKKEEAWSYEHSGCGHICGVGV